MKLICLSTPLIDKGFIFDIIHISTIIRFLRISPENNDIDEWIPFINRPNPALPCLVSHSKVPHVSLWAQTNFPRFQNNALFQFAFVGILYILHSSNFNKPSPDAIHRTARNSKFPGSSHSHFIIWSCEIKSLSFPFKS